MPDETGVVVRSPSAGAYGAAFGTVIFAFFGALWISAAFLMHHPRNVTTFSALTMIVILLVAPAGRIMRRTKERATGAPTPASERSRREFRNVNIAQWTAIIILIIAANVIQRPHIILPGVMLIVGVHFLPLARTFGYWPHYVTGIAMVVWALLYPHLFPLGTQDPAGPFGTGVIVLLSGLNSLITAKRLEKKIERV